MYYTQSSGGYTVVSAPVNVVVETLPIGAEEVEMDKDEYYYFGGTFYSQTKEGYKVVNAPDGAIILNIPEGAKEEEIDGNKYVTYNNVYFQPMTQDGKDVYQVVSMVSSDS